MEDNNNAVITKRPPFWACITIVTFLAVILVAQILVFGSPDVHMTMIFALAFSSVVLLLTGTKWDAIEEGIIHGSKIAILPMLILMFIGMLIPTLIACGTIPTLIYYGLQLISPKAFLVTAAIVCSICSIVTGSSWTTGGTFGVAFMAIGAGLGIPGGMTAGAVISGAVIGDKMSPMSDSTNLAPAVAECNIFDHISAMMRTTIPAFIISLVLYFVLGMRFSADSIDQSTFNAILDGISANWDTGALYVLLSIIPLAVVLFMAVKKMSAVATMVVASLVAMVIAMITKGYGIGEMMSFMNYGFVIDTGDAFLNRLLNRGGLQNMLWTCSLGYIALPFGGILETTGVMDVLLEKLQNVTKNAKGLIITHVFFWYPCQSALCFPAGFHPPAWQTFPPGLQEAAHQELHLLPHLRRLCHLHQPAGSLGSLWCNVYRRPGRSHDGVSPLCVPLLPCPRCYLHLCIPRHCN